jgi:hypothetical protein
MQPRHGGALGRPLKPFSWLGQTQFATPPPGPKAVARLADDWDRLETFYQFPDEHWPHLRTSNIVESPFATVRLRTTAAKRFKKVENASTVIWKLLQVAESTFRRLRGAELLPAVYVGEQCKDGVLRSAYNGRWLPDCERLGIFPCPEQSKRVTRQHALPELWL